MGSAHVSAQTTCTRWCRRNNHTEARAARIRWRRRDTRRADGAISVGYARRHTDAFGYVVLANELSLVIAPIAGLLGALIGHGVAHSWRSRRIRPLPGVASVAFASELS